MGVLNTGFHGYFEHGRCEQRLHGGPWLGAPDTLIVLNTGVVNNAPTGGPWLGAPDPLVVLNTGVVNNAPTGGPWLGAPCPLIVLNMGVVNNAPTGVRGEAHLAP
jgi:hypothetical protein